MAIMVPREEITGLVLAGGRGSRMNGQDKGLAMFRGRPLVSYALAAIQMVTTKVLISANRNLEAYREFGCPVVVDPTGHFDGPLAGLLSGLRAAETEYLLTVPCDCPLMSGKLLDRLGESLIRQRAELAVPFDGERIHPVFLLVTRKLATADLEDYLKSGQRKMELWLNRHSVALADFSDVTDSLINLNTLEELHRIQGY